jgi:putative phage-type endonuclease
MTGNAVSTLTPAQQADRAKGLGGSDCAAALGMSRWKSALQLYLEKLGEIEVEDLDENERVEWGVRLEPVVRQKYSDVTGRTVVLPTETVFHPALPWMFCHPDGFSNDGRIYSGKVAERMEGWGEPGSADVPQEYFLQSQHEMIVLSAVLGRPIEVVDYGVLFAGNKFRQYVVEADAEIQDMIVDGESAFFDTLAKRVAPAPDYNARNIRQLLAKMFPGTNGEILQATESQIAWRRVNEEGKSRADVYYAAAEAAKTALLFDMGEAAQLVFPDGKALRRKLIQKKAYTVEPTSYVDSRFAAVKE